MYSKTSDITCTTCGKSGHLSVKCWIIVGYPPKHPKYQRGKGKEPYSKKGGYNNSKHGQRWNKNRNDNKTKMAANVRGERINVNYRVI